MMQYPYDGQTRRTRYDYWKEAWPTGIVAIIAIGQMLLTFAIISIETWSMMLSLRYSFAFVGYSASFFFTITWISTFTVVCCKRGSRGCATHALVENIISIIASVVLIYYDSQFLRFPTSCFWTNEICLEIGSSINWNILDSYDIFDLRRTKLIAIKSQLACASIMLILSLCFFIIYLHTAVKVRNKQVTVSPNYTTELRPIQLPHEQNGYMIRVVG